MNSLLAVFSFSMFMMGLILSVLTYDAQQKLSTECVNHRVQIGLNFMLMLSVMMVVLPLMQLFCHWHCGCPQYDIPYVTISMMILVVMGTTSMTVWSGLKGKCNADNTIRFSLTTAILSFTLVAIYIAYIVKSKSSGGLKTHSGSAASSIEMTSL
jgi:hypothetical protein